MRHVISTILLLLLVSCTEKPKAIIKIDTKLQLPISCIKLNPIGVEKKFIDTLKNLYTFDDRCEYHLHLSYKKNIVCNSSHNSVAKSTGKFPRSFLKLELRKGLEVQYSYYIDLLDNIDKEDIHVAFMRLKNDMQIKPKKI